MGLGRALSQATLLAIALTLVPGVGMLYVLARNLELQRASAQLVDETAVSIAAHIADMRRAERSVMTLAEALNRRLDAPPDPAEPADFDALTAADQYGVTRNRKDRFDGRTEAGVFIPADVPLTDDLKRRKLRAMQVLSTYGRAALVHVDGVWFDQLDKTSVIFWRPDPNFIYTLPPDHDYTQTLWDQLASPALNPNRRPMWTPAILETTVGTWVVSCVYPLDRGGRWEGVVGQDIALHDLIGAFQSTQLYPGGHHFLLDLDPDKNGKREGAGAYILAGPWQKQLEAKSGDFKPDLTAEPQLANLLWGQGTHESVPTLLGAESGIGEATGVIRQVSMRGEDYLAVVLDLLPMNWRYVHLVPLSAVLAPMHKLFYALAGLLSILLVTAALMVRQSVRRLIVKPLERIIEAVRAYSLGDREWRTRMTGPGEVAMLGQALDSMADSVQNAIQAHSESEDRYRTVVENVREVIFQCDRHLQLDFLSTAWTALTGWPVAESLRRQLAEFLHPDDIERGRADLRSVVDGTALTCSGTYRLLRRDGETRWIEVHLQRAAGASTESVFIGTIDDITERLQGQTRMLQLQEQLRQAQKMEALGRLTGGVAHDFNNILAIILGYTEMAMDTEDGRRSDRLRPMLQQIMQAGERGRDLVSKMLMFSRRTGGVPAPTKPQPVIAEAVELLKATIPANLELVTDIDPDAGSVLADATGLHQVVMNLIINARDATPAGGRITVGLRGEVSLLGACSACHGDIHGRFVEIFVQDPGTGIAAETLPNIFDPFFTTKEFGRGTGMGLSVIHGIVHESGGHIVVESREGVGTTVRLLFPVQPAVQLPAPAPIAPAPAVVVTPCINTRVLFADDEPGLVKLWERALGTHGYAVDAFTDSGKALAAFRQAPHAYDVIIIDQTMPGVSGDEFARAVLALRPGMPIVLCTGYSETIDAGIAAGMGIGRFLLKPVALADMLSALSEVMARASAQPPKRRMAQEDQGR